MDTFDTGHHARALLSARTHPRAEPRDFLLVVLGAALWGTGGLAGAALATDADLGMLTVAAYRLLVGGGLLLVVLAAVGRLHLRPSRAVGRRIVVTGVLAALYQGCYFVAVAWTSVSVATVVALGAAPVLVAAATAVTSRRRPSARTVVALASVTTGLLLLVGLSSGGGARPVAGALLALGSAAGFATMTMVNRAPVEGLGPLALTATSFTVGAVLLVPVVAVAGGWGAPVTAGGWVLVLYLGVGPTAAAYAAYFSGLRTVPATTASLVALLEPLTAALGAFVLRDERVGVSGLVGAALLVVAVVVLRPRAVASPTMDVGLR